MLPATSAIAARFISTVQPVARFWVRQAGNPGGRRRRNDSAIRRSPASTSTCRAK